MTAQTNCASNLSITLPTQGQQMLICCSSRAPSKGKSYGRTQKLIKPPRLAKNSAGPQENQLRARCGKRSEEKGLMPGQIAFFWLARDLSSKHTDLDDSSFGFDVFPGSVSAIIARQQESPCSIQTLRCLWLMVLWSPRFAASRSRSSARAALGPKSCVIRCCWWQGHHILQILAGPRPRRNVITPTPDPTQTAKKLRSEKLAK